MQFKLFGNSSINNLLTTENFYQINVYGMLESSTDLNPGDLIYLVGNQYDEYVFKVCKKAYVDGSTYLFVENATLSELNEYGSGEDCDLQFEIDIRECYIRYMKKHATFNYNDSEQFTEFVRYAYDTLNIQNLPFNTTCMLHRISAIFAKIVGIKWHKPAYYDNF